MNYAELSRRAEEYQMKKITLKTVIEALQHCSDKQEKDLLEWLNKDANGWAGHELGEIISEHIESMEAEEEHDAEFDREHKLYLAARNRA